MDFLSTLILTGYLGIYLCLLQQPVRFPLRRFVWITIFGGVYLFVSDHLFRFFSFDSPVGRAMALMIGQQPFGYSGQGRLMGSAFNPNYACYLLILALAFLSVELLNAVRTGHRRTMLLSLALLPILDLAIYETESRAGIVIMILIHLLFLFKLSRRVFVPVLTLSVLAAPFVYQWMPRTGSTELSFDKRVAIWKNSLHIFFDNPLFGTTSFGFREDYIALTGRMIPHAHDLFLAVLSTSGMFCFLFFIAVVGVSVYNLIRLQRSSSGRSYTAELFLFALPTLILYGLMDFPLSSPQIMIIVLAMTGYWIRYTARVRHLVDMRHPLRLILRRHLTRRRRKEATSVESFKNLL
ncbi:O-antigen ligase [Sporolactobacillus sp. THM19-2]|nr:O-antigen ligase family protein [Sporolactobacillus sp. THM19-2]RYL92373.1 O-antigen ligase domain-containing protein [Sporolactobacillus sp. THM19-2]